MGELAIHGGRPVIADPLPPYRAMGVAEEAAVIEVVRSGCLSGYYGSWCDEFHGGPRVRSFEAAWCERFGSSHAIAVNSATSGLFAAAGAIGLEPGDEVIVPPLTMSATAMAPLIYGAIPVFVDVEPETFCLDIDAVNSAIGPRTRAIMAVNLFGHTARLGELRSLADERGLLLIEDSAQSPLASEAGRLAGTVGHIGVFSLNFHKHIHSGEGGVCVTDDDDLADRLAMIRNHGENVAGPRNISRIVNLIGFNYRMTELCAAIGLVQLGNIEQHVDRRAQLAQSLSEGAAGLAGLVPPIVRADCRHVYYVWALRLDSDELGISRDAFSRALAAEGFPHGRGYVEPLYTLPVFEQRIAFGSQGWPFSLSEVRYGDGLCPVAERLHRDELLIFEPCSVDADSELTTKLVEALRKVHANRESLAR